MADIRSFFGGGSASKATGSAEKKKEIPIDPASYFGSAAKVKKVTAKDRVESNVSATITNESNNSTNNIGNNKNSSTSSPTPTPSINRSSISPVKPKPATGTTKNEAVDVDVDDMEVEDVKAKTTASQEAKDAALAKRLQAEEDKKHLHPPTSSTTRRETERMSPQKSPSRLAGSTTTSVAGSGGVKRSSTSAVSTPPTKKAKKIRDEDDDYNDEDDEESTSKSTPQRASTSISKKNSSDKKKSTPPEGSGSKAGEGKTKSSTMDDDNPYTNSTGEKKKKVWFNPQARAHIPPPNLGGKPVPTGQPGCLKNLTFVITGVLDSLEREDATDLIKRYGGKVTSAVSGKTDYLVLGLDAGQSKKDKAEEKGTKVIDEDGLFQLIKTRKGDGSTPAPASSSSSKPPSASDIAARSVTQIATASPALTKTLLSIGGQQASSVSDLLWVDKYRPQQLKDIIGGATNIGVIENYLRSFETMRNDTNAEMKAGAAKDRKRAILISGNPGIGKTTAACFVARSKGYEVVEFNASDVRNKKKLDELVGSMIGNRGMTEFFKEKQVNNYHLSSSSSSVSKKLCIIMDEVDGMSGNEDRGGMGELLQLIKRSRTPIICIANDASTPKMRSLKNYCTQITWRRPTAQQILPRITEICKAEGLAIDTGSLEKIIEGSQGDIRQILNFLQMHRKTSGRLSFDEAKHQMTVGSGKDFDTGVWEVIPEFFRPPDPKKKWMDDRMGLYFIDAGLVPLFIQDLYLKGRARADPTNNSPKDVQTMIAVAEASDFISDSDLVESEVRAGQEYSLMPNAALLSSVAPGYMMSGGSPGLMGFPTWLGQNSSRTKKLRLLKEMRFAMTLTHQASIKELITEDIPILLRQSLAGSLQQFGADAIPDVIGQMEELGMNRDDWLTMLEVTDAIAPQSQKLETLIDSKVKSAFTRNWNKYEEGHKFKAVRMGLKGTAEGVTKGPKIKVGVDELEEEEVDEEEMEAEAAGEAEEEEGEEKDEIKADKMIKQVAEKGKKGKATAASISSTSTNGTPSSTGRGRGSRGGGSGRGSRGGGRGRGRVGAAGSSSAPSRSKRGGSASKSKKRRSAGDDEEDEDEDDFVLEDDDDDFD